MRIPLAFALAMIGAVCFWLAATSTEPTAYRWIAALAGSANLYAAFAVAERRK